MPPVALKAGLLCPRKGLPWGVLCWGAPGAFCLEDGFTAVLVNLPLFQKARYGE